MPSASLIVTIVSYGAAVFLLALAFLYAPLPPPHAWYATLALVTMASFARLQLPRTRWEIILIYPMLLSGIWIAGPCTAVITLFPYLVAALYRLMSKKEILSPHFPHPASLLIISALGGLIFLKTGGVLSFASITPAMWVPLLLSTMAILVPGAIEPLFSPGRKREPLAGRLRFNGTARLIDCAFVPLSLMIVIIFSNWGIFYLVFLLVPLLFFYFFLKKSFRHYEEKDELNIFYRFTTLIRSSLDLEQILKDLTEELLEVTGAAGAMLALVEGKNVTMALCKGSLEHQAPPDRALIESIIFPQLQQPGDARLLSRETADRWIGETCPREFSLTPLLEEGSPTGFIVSVKESFSPRDHKYLAIIAAQASSSITNAKLYQQALKANEDLRQAQAQLIQSGKMAAVGQLAAGVAHELNNPMGAVLTNFQTLPPFLGEREDLLANLKEAEKAVIECKGIIEKLLHYSRQAEMSDQQVSMKAIILDTLELLREQCELEEIRVNEELADTPQIPGNPNLLQQVVTNLFMNAFDAIKEGGRKDGMITLSTCSSDSHVLFSVKDNGTGIADDLREEIFDPMFTTKGMGKAAGLGLSVSRDIVSGYGGSIEVETKLHEGSTFIVKLPYK